MEIQQAMSLEIVPDLLGRAVKQNEAAEGQDLTVPLQGFQAAWCRMGGFAREVYLEIQPDGTRVFRLGASDGTKYVSMVVKPNGSLCITRVMEVNGIWEKREVQF